MDGKGNEFLSHPFMFESGSFQKKNWLYVSQESKTEIGIGFVEMLLGREACKEAKLGDWKNWKR